MTKSLRTTLWIWLPLVAWMGVIYYLSAQPHLPNPQTGFWGELLSSGAHVAIFGVLAILWVRALGARPRSAWLALGLTMLYALTDEFHQSFVPGRCPDPWDLVCDGLGALLGLAAWFAWRRWRNKRG